jgi:hypothetical protein
MVVVVWGRCWRWSNVGCIGRLLVKVRTAAVGSRRSM